jgi:hypothetical protein
MDRIGFGSQPHVVYQHFDAGHPHVHIVSTTIQRDGSRIIMYNIGRKQSEEARKAIEEKYGLVRASGRKPVDKETVTVQKLIYGKSEIKRVISNVVRTVVQNYKFTSLPEFNAILGQFNIIADRGSEKSFMFSKRGLHYRVLDSHGRKIGVPIKASSIYSCPTLAVLEKQFALNEELRRPHKGRMIQCIDSAFSGKSVIPGDSFIKALKVEGIHVVFRQNEEGRVYGITFVDNRTRVVFNGSDLGKPYSAKAITERLTNLSERPSIKNSAEAYDFAIEG